MTNGILRVDARRDGRKSLASSFTFDNIIVFFVDIRFFM